MHRRGLVAWATRIVLAIVAAASVAVASPAAATVDEEPAPTRPPVTVSDFIPEETNLSDCVGLVEKPGCGSESRGGWRQGAIFVALATGLGLIIWRITVGLRANARAGSESRP